MKRKSKLDPLPVDPKRARLAANFEIKPHQKNEDTTESVLESLPLDLKLDILTRLPAKSLVNSRRVSKKWYSIIRSGRFSRMFSSISSTRPRLVVVLTNGCCNIHEEYLTFFFSFDQGDSSTSSLVPDFDLAMPDVKFGTDILSGHCTSVHQFLALEFGFKTWICNPATEQCFKLPDGTTYLGYDPILGNYKAFCVPSNEHHKVKTLGGGQVWRHIKSPITTSYTPMGAGVNINGFLYYGAYHRYDTAEEPVNPGIMCFDVRYEKLSYIKAPLDVVRNPRNSAFFEYKGKLASTVINYLIPLKSFDLFVLEDVENHQWSKTTCVVPPSLWDFEMSFPGTNKAGEIILAPKTLPRQAQPFYIFYYNVETRNIRSVRLLGIGDSQEFMRSYGFLDKGECQVRIAPQHIENIVFFKHPGS